MPLLLAAVAAGCVNRDKSDLEKFVASVLKRPGGQIEPLPPIRPYQRYLYQSGEAQLRNPFENFMNVQPQEAVAATEGTDANQQRFADEISAHNREELESFELDSLRMVGTLQDDDELWGIVRDAGGTVHRVQIGNYLGRNFGKILNIQEDRIDLREVVKDSEGRWEERQASLALEQEEGNP
ncbi:MAG: pilus assembly protein PilP [Gammaproteobacteria bacterium]